MGFNLSWFAERDGVTLKAKNRLARYTITDIDASSLNITPMKPGIKNKGKRTMKFVIVEAIRAFLTSFVANSAASLGGSPLSL